MKKKKKSEQHPIHSINPFRVKGQGLTLGFQSKGTRQRFKAIESLRASDKAQQTLEEKFLVAEPRLHLLFQANKGE